LERIENLQAWGAGPEREGDGVVQSEHAVLLEKTDAWRWLDTRKKAERTARNRRPGPDLTLKYRQRGGVVQVVAAGHLHPPRARAYSGIILDA
jgi:predicted phosphodiesterase